MLKRQETLMQWGLGQYSSKVHPVNKQMDWLVIENNFLLLTKFFFFSLKNTTADCFDLHSDQANRTNHHQNKKSTLLDNIFMIYTVSSENRDRCSPCSNAFSFSTNCAWIYICVSKGNGWIYAVPAVCGYNVVTSSSERSPQTCRMATCGWL